MHFTSVNQLPAISVAETLNHARGVVDLWYYFHEGATPELLAKHEILLSPDERERHQKYHFERDRRIFLATRALVRTVLSKYSPVAPVDWRFSAGEHGKPSVSAPAVTPQLFFNLANTHGLVVCVVSAAHGEVGVDVERIDRKVETTALAKRYFSASEFSTMQALPASEHLRRFFTYWTLKESYIKARGLGLRLPLDRFSFLIEDEIKITFEAGFANNASSWKFAHLDAPPDHMIAVSVNTGGTALSLRAAQVAPLGAS
jgi:4'-phosphopantetheinyl transferase